MDPTNRVVQTLIDFSVPHLRILHRQALSAGQVAHESHVPFEAMAKVVVTRDARGRYFMAVLPASKRLDLAALERATGAGPLALATETELGRLFPDCEPGAMPPFGGPYDLPTFVDGSLGRAPEIYFQAGNHRETVAMSWAEYERLAAPVIGHFCQHHRRDAA
jgi:Ala-tRNA(Pro) deacylase